MYCQWVKTARSSWVGMTFSLMGHLMAPPPPPLTPRGSCAERKEGEQKRAGCTLHVSTCFSKTEVVITLFIK